MKKHLLPVTGQFYKANLHCHTTFSDACLTPERVKEIYKSKGYAVVAYTDHELLFPQNHLTDETFLALNGVEHDVDEKAPDDDTGRKFHLCCIALEPNNHLTPCPEEAKYAYGNLPHLHLAKPVPGTLNFPKVYTPESINRFMAEVKNTVFS